MRGFFCGWGEARTLDLGVMSATLPARTERYVRAGNQLSYLRLSVWLGRGSNPRP